MRWSVVAFLVPGLLLSSLPANAAPHRHRTPGDEAEAIVAKADGGVEASPRPRKPIELPSGYYERYESPPVTYYEGENCSGSPGTDGYYEDDSTMVVYSGDDDDDYVGDDDDDTTTVTGDDDDDDDDYVGDDDDDSVDIEWGDDDDDDDDVTTMSAPRPAPHRSPVSRLALLGVLLAFPLRRRGTLAGHARRRHGGQ